MDTRTSRLERTRLERRSDRRRLGLGLAALAVTATGFTTVVTGAVFTDSQAVGNNTFTTGTVDLAATPTTAAVTLTNMAPGDTVTAPLTVANDGSLQYRYSLVSTATSSTPDLAAQLDLTVKTGITAANCTTANFGASGTVAYGPGDLGSTGGTAIFGSAAQGQQTGDRTVAAGASEVLCVQVTLPTTTGNTYQAKTTTATFTFDAEQTVNN